MGGLGFRDEEHVIPWQRGASSLEGWLIHSQKTTIEKHSYVPGILGLPLQEEGKPGEEKIKVAFQVGRDCLSRMHEPRNRDKAKEANGAGQRGFHRPCEELGLLENGAFERS